MCEEEGEDEGDGSEEEGTVINVAVQDNGLGTRLKAWVPVA